SRGGGRRARAASAPRRGQWRGIGLIPQSGWQLPPEFAAYDAARRFSVGAIATRESPVCIAGQILQGLKRPHECPAFAGACTPATPLGATMVSSEGACAAYYRYRRFAPRPAEVPAHV